MCNKVLTSFRAKLTAFYPGPYVTEEEEQMEGGAFDRMGARLRTLDDFMLGRAEYVSTAADVDAFRYGAPLCIPELDEHFGKQIRFRVVDTGSAFRGKGRERLDICVATHAESLNPVLNKSVLVVCCDAR